jgi:site-specific DNA-methyltransferase (adenine-specific)
MSLSHEHDGAATVQGQANRFDSTLSGALFSKKSDEWATPRPLFDWLNSTFQFTLDACATASNCKCDRFYSKVDNGLSQSWAGERVFLNPPYSEVGKWVEKAYREAQDGATVVCLTAARVDTRWFQDFVLGKANEIQFLPGRVTFMRDGQPPNTAPFPSVIIVFRPPPKRSSLRLSPVCERSPSRL